MLGVTFLRTGAADRDLYHLLPPVSQGWASSVLLLCMCVACLVGGNLGSFFRLHKMYKAGFQCPTLIIGVGTGGAGGQGGLCPLIF